MADTHMRSGLKKITGFTIVEMMIAIAIMSILIALAAPSFTSMLRNGKVRSMAETISAGLQLARSEAIKRNGAVVFALVANDPATIIGAAPPGAGPAYAAAGPHWVVFREAPLLTYERIDGRLNSEGSGSGAASTLLTGTTPGAAQLGSVAFNAFGRVESTITPPANAVFTVNTPGGTCGTGASDVRCLNVVVTPAGSIKMCDPQVPATALTDSRRCP